MPAVILIVTQLAGLPIRTDAWIAVIASTVLLTIYSFFAGRRGGLGLGGSVLSAAIGALLGILVIGLKAALHNALSSSKAFSSTGASWLDGGSARR